MTPAVLQKPEINANISGVSMTSCALRPGEDDCLGGLSGTTGYKSSMHLTVYNSYSEQDSLTTYATLETTLSSMLARLFLHAHIAAKQSGTRRLMCVLWSCSCSPGL